MNCNDIAEALVGVRLPSALPHETEDHLRSCKRCRELVRALSVQVAEEAPSPAILRQIEEGLVKELQPVHPIAPRRYFFAFLIAIFACVLTVGVYRIGAFAFAVMTPLQTTVIMGVLAICTGLLAYSLVNQMIPGSRHWIPPGLLPLGVIISLAITVAFLFRFQAERHFWANNWACIKAGTPIAALAAVPIWLVLRRGAILSRGLIGAATGLLAGLVGTTALEIHCPNLDVRHILVSHLGVAMIGLIAGLVLGLAGENGKARRSPTTP
jgi:hypothetical protein